MYKAKFSNKIYFNVVIDNACNCVDFSLDPENEIRRIWLGVDDFLANTIKL